jgi:protein-tyrosine phosphatase
MQLFQLDDQGLLYISPDIDDWQPVVDTGISAVIDLDGDLDIGVPAMPNQLLYIYFPFEDRHLPDLHKLHNVARLGANLVAGGSRVLSHCHMGHNRCALVAGVILTYLGMSGEQALERVRQRRPAALYNEEYARYLQSLPPMVEPSPRLSRLS